MNKNNPHNLDSKLPIHLRKDYINRTDNQVQELNQMIREAIWSPSGKYAKYVDASVYRIEALIASEVRKGRIDEVQTIARGLHDSGWKDSEVNIQKVIADRINQLNSEVKE